MGGSFNSILPATDGNHNGTDLDLDLEFYEIGIVKNKSTDVYFADYQTNFAMIDNMLMTSPYQFLPQSSSPHRLPLLSNVMDENIWRNEFYDPIEQIVRDANLKRQELYNLLIQNPFFPWHKARHEWVRSIYCQMMISCAAVPWIGSILMTLGSLLIGFPLFLASLLLSALNYLLDMIFCRLQFCRRSSAEMQFIERIFQLHPELDTQMIDTEIHRKLQEVAIKLSEQYPQLKLHLKTGHQQVVDEKNSEFYMQDYFILTVQRPVTAKTEDALEMV